MNNALEEQLNYTSFFDMPCYGVPQQVKEKKLAQALYVLTQHHAKQCTLYANLLNAYAFDSVSSRSLSLAEFIPLSVRLFKTFELRSISEEEIFKTLTSSGTTDQRVSQIYLDQNLAQLQSQALVKILQAFIGIKRLPMLIVDKESINKEREAFSARAAGIRGLATFGRDHTYLLDDHMEINVQRMLHFLEKYQGQPILIFGFTFLVWEYLLKRLKQSPHKINLSQAVLIHSGGWKKMVEHAVDNVTFKRELSALTGIKKIHNFYGMVEQVGSIFMECEAGYLHAPVFADLLVRDLKSHTLQPIGGEGVVEVLSVLPHSYPGHVLLTEDLGTVHGIDDCSCGRLGKYFTISGRIPKSEMRGCSDTYREVNPI